MGQRSPDKGGDNMKKALKKTAQTLYYYKGNVRIGGKNPDMRGNCSGFRGDINNCRLTSKDRQKGVDIATLVAE